MAKRILGAALLMGMAGSAYAAPASVNGRWLTKDRDAVIEIAPCGPVLCGRIQRFLVAPPQGNDQRDINNSNKAARNRKLLGLAVLSDFKPDGDQWKGKIYDPKTGKTYRSVMFKTKSGSLTVKGCIGPFCQSQSWSRAN